MNHDMLAEERLKSRLKAIDQRVRLDRIKIIDQEANLFQKSMKQETAKLIREESKRHKVNNFSIPNRKFQRRPSKILSWGKTLLNDSSADLRTTFPGPTKPKTARITRHGHLPPLSNLKNTSTSVTYQNKSAKSNNKIKLTESERNVQFDKVGERSRTLDPILIAYRNRQVLSKT